MADIDDSWTTNSNDALTLSLVTPSADGVQPIASFHPKFTYPVFGDEEQIFGYRDLKVHLRYHASDMRPNLAVSYAKKFAAVGDTEPANIEELLGPFLPQVAFQKSRDFEAAIRDVGSRWTPPGTLHSSYETRSGAFEVWRGSLADPAVKQLVARIQILVSLFIEGGTPIDLDEPDADRWTVFFLYRKQPVQGAAAADPPSYTFAGYATVYRFFLYRPPPTPPPSPPSSDRDLDLGDGNFDLSALPCRSRISQFVVIPPFQGQGHGPRLYGALFRYYLEQPQTVEITVEDPNEAFDDLRDLADLRFLRTVPAFRALRINTGIRLPRNGPVPRDIVDPVAYEAVRRQVKIAPRQFARALEMHLMARLPDAVRPGIAPDTSTSRQPRPEEAHEYALWRLLVKRRLYRQNRDTLAQMELRERGSKLDETVGSVEFEYARLLALYEARNGDGDEAGGSPDGKRKREENGEASSSKRARVEDA